MKTGKLIICNIFTFIWLFVILLAEFGGYMSEGQTFSFDVGGYNIAYIFYHYVVQYYIAWPDKILFNIFYAKAGIYPTWIIIISLMVSLGSCIIVDFLLRKFLWNRKRKNVE
jgi:hypothetical protein